MRFREYLVLFVLAALWGSSFLFIRVAVTELSPLSLVGARSVIATIGLLLVVPFQSRVLQGWRTHLGSFAVVAIFNAIIPYLAISWGEQYVPSGLAAILTSTLPLATVIISHWWPGGERITWQRFAGVAIGIVGVAIVIGPTALNSGVSISYVLGICSILLGAISYAIGGLLAHQLLVGLPSILPALGQTALGACILGPIAAVAFAVHPAALPLSGAVVASVLGLALAGTTFAYICFYWLIDHVGPTRTVIVTYLLPCMALVYGALLLHESIGINALAGLAIVLLGIFLVGRKTAGQSLDEHTVQAAHLQVKTEERINS
ncbi:MAG TPA: EamA family transporter [Ktedonobacteraceae bacterium]|jgi:drug/metabolite transporter (DMT)-like permease|nr:EamA family transporter [Ktedonobacteraceae bacterium]